MYKNKGKHIETFNREKRLNEKISHVPGPNRYNIKQELYEKKQQISFRRLNILIYSQKQQQYHLL
jgi:hypothetical protein